MNKQTTTRQPKRHPGLFAKYERRGKDWLKELNQDDRKAFACLGMTHACEKLGYQEFHSKGGKTRAANAQRDSKGRFKSTQTIVKEHAPFWDDRGRFHGCPENWPDRWADAWIEEYLS